ncbi:hypothetical protein LJR234_001670 [Mesorhizobium amorphae]|uniref:hypothetical protein n=1 Tax=Mesorhizobium amorphae TaxID=71433 RepID=UPI003ECE4FE2
MAFYDGSMFPEWRGSILVGGCPVYRLYTLRSPRRRRGSLFGRRRPHSRCGCSA